MGDPVRVGDVLNGGDTDSAQRARSRFDARLETIAALDETAVRGVVDHAAAAARELDAYPALAAWVAAGHAASALRRARGADVLADGDPTM